MDTKGTKNNDVKNFYQYSSIQDDHPLIKTASHSYWSIGNPLIWEYADPWGWSWEQSAPRLQTSSASMRGRRKTWLQPWPWAGVAGWRGGSHPPSTSDENDGNENAQASERHRQGIWRRKKKELLRTTKKRKRTSKHFQEEKKLVRRVAGHIFNVFACLRMKDLPKCTATSVHVRHNLAILSLSPPVHLCSWDISLRATLF